MKIPIDVADDILELLVAKALSESRSVDNWLDLHLREHFYGAVALMSETASNAVLPLPTKRDVSARRRAQVFRLSGGLCHYCRVALDAFYWECDHIVPLASGGTNEITNLVAACPDCNAKKSTTSADEFEKRRNGNAA